MDIIVRVDWDTLEATAKVSIFHTPINKQDFTPICTKTKNINQVNKQEIKAHTVDINCLRTFARKFSTIDFSLKILPLKDDELVMSEM